MANNFKVIKKDNNEVGYYTCFKFGDKKYYSDWEKYIIVTEKGNLFAYTDYNEFTNDFKLNK